LFNNTVGMIWDKYKTHLLLDTRFLLDSFASLYLPRANTRVIWLSNSSNKKSSIQQEMPFLYVFKQRKQLNIINVCKTFCRRLEMVIFDERLMNVLKTCYGRQCI
jgi:hypothetical protein